MKTNRRYPQLVISLASLEIPVREIVSAHIQRALFSMGFVWSDGNWRKGQPQETDRAVLLVNSREWPANHITYVNGPLCIHPDTDGPTKVFDVTDVNEFLEAASKCLVEKTFIRGVDVTITPDGLKLDPTHLLSRVAKEASDAQKKLFG